MKRVAIAGAIFVVVAIPVSAQNQVKPPIAVYWVSAETNAGMGMAMPTGMGGMMPPGMQGGKRLKLDLGSAQSASGEPRADHAIPANLNMGNSLPLLTPQGERPQGRPEQQSDPRYEQPKGRMLIYWGCGETIRAGQPVIVDFAKLGSQDAAKAFRSRNVSRPTGPAAGRNRTYGEWPNRQNGTAVPAQASLQGDHVVAGNYSPEIRFAVDDRHDFMAPVAFDPVRKTSAGAFQVTWQSIPTAIGYFATAVGQGETQNDVVMWSSSDVQEMGQALMDYLPPAEVQRLIKEKVVMTPQTTECSVPAGIFKGEGAMLNFIGYGDELNVVHPPRPKDPKQVWEQQYAVKVRLKSTGMTMLTERDMGNRARAPARGADTSGQQADERSTPRAPSPADAVKEGVNVLRGIFGR
ncbi:MAG: hypothetical protein ACXWCS_21730 [Burkholderiales bacterium]